MTIGSDISVVTLEGNGLATEFPFSFKVWKSADLEVVLLDPDGTESTTENWTVELSDQGGTVTYPSAGDPLPTGWKLSIVRNMDFLQEVDLVSGTRWDPEVVETALDQATAERQQLREGLSRSVKVPVASILTPDELVESIFDASDAAQAAASSAATAQAAAEAARDAAEAFTTGTDLSYTASTRVLASSTGEDVTLPEATTESAGLMSAAAAEKLAGIVEGWELSPGSVIYMRRDDEVTHVSVDGDNSAGDVSYLGYGYDEIGGKWSERLDPASPIYDAQFVGAIRVEAHGTVHFSADLDGDAVFLVNGGQKYAYRDVPDGVYSTEVTIATVVKPGDVIALKLIDEHPGLTHKARNFRILIASLER